MKALVGGRDNKNGNQVKWKNVQLIVEPIFELHRGFRNNAIPWIPCASWSVISLCVLLIGFDHYVFVKSGFEKLYPFYPILYRIYSFIFITGAFWLWALNEMRKKQIRLSQLTSAFKNSGLQSVMGRLPNLVSDFQIDSQTRKLTLTNAGFPLKTFRDKQPNIESALGVFIDDIKERRERQTVELIYSHFPMPKEILYESLEREASLEVIVGQTRATTVRTSLKENPHYLIAGQTGGGKSTFVRQLVTHFYLGDESAEFLLIDLKGGLEFSLFENRKRITVIPTVLKAVTELEKVSKFLDKRMEILKNAKCKDVDAYISFKPPEGEKKLFMNRHIIVVDEAAEMFLAGHHAKAKEIQVARESLSRIARLGRAAGVHLIVATQRPDAKSLDPQVKSNLTGVLCFQMMNDASSISVLGNGRATDLPKVPGRAIWKSGMNMSEVQTPFLSVEEVEKLLGPPEQPEKESTVVSPAKIVPSVQSTSIDGKEADGCETD